MTQITVPIKPASLARLRQANMQIQMAQQRFSELAQAIAEAMDIDPATIVNSSSIIQQGVFTVMEPESPSPSKEPDGESGGDAPASRELNRAERRANGVKNEAVPQVGG